MPRLVMLLRNLRRKCFRLLGRIAIKERESEFILENIDHREQKLILDVGCWSSLLPEVIGKRGHKVYGVDVQDYGKPRGFSFIKADIINSDLPFEKFTFDYIVCVSSLEHIGLGYYGDVRRVNGDRLSLERMHLLSKDTGKLLITIPFGGNYTEDGFQRIHSKNSIKKLIHGLFEIEKEQYWIPLGKRKWIPGSEEAAKKVYHVYPESNNGCFVLKKITN